jgi:hypothetical protein
LFKATPLIFAALIRNTPDKNGHMSRLVITTSERDRLLQNLKSSFGDKLDADNQNYVVSAASVLKGYLEKDYKCADEPE